MRPRPRSSRRCRAPIEQKVLFSQCSNCHSLQWALRQPRTKEAVGRDRHADGGRRDARVESLASMTIGQKQFIEPLAEYLASIRGPDSSDKIPFKLRPRPTDEASTNLVVTEYARAARRPARTLHDPRRFAASSGRTTSCWTTNTPITPTTSPTCSAGSTGRRAKSPRLPFQLPSGAGRDEGGG